MKKNIWPAYLTLLFLCLLETGVLEAQKIKSVPFSFSPDASGDLYHQQLPQKAYALDNSEFIILSRKADKTYALERYRPDLKVKWSTPLNLLPSETIEAFSRNNQYALIITHRTWADQGSQALFGRLIDLATGKETETKKLQEAPSKGRKLGLAISEAGSALVTYQSIATVDQELRSMQARVYDGKLSLLRERTYDFAGSGGQVAAQVRIDNRGDQYVCLLTDNSSRLSVRRYTNQSADIKVMEVMVGGVFSGEKMYVVNSQFEVQQDSSLYAAVLVAEEKTGEYRSLKMVKFDYAIQNMRFAEEFRFTPSFTQSVLKSSGATRLDDVYLSEILVNPQGTAVVIAERKFTEGGVNSPYHAKEMFLFAYDEYLKPTWHSVVLKDQVSPATEGFSGISYKARLFGGKLQLLTLETLKGKTDLYSRTLHLSTGTSEPAKAIGLNLAQDHQISYAKDFTTWLDEQTVITVNRPSKTSAGLRLSRITFKD